MRTCRCDARFTAFAAMLMLLFASGCAEQPPNVNMLSGKRLIVTMTYNDAINPRYHYFFLINYASSSSIAGDKNAPGPIPVLVPPYGNGFATGSNASSAGITDFVEFNGAQGYALYHFNGNPNIDGFTFESRPLNSVIPDPNDTSRNKLQFEIDLSQIVPNVKGAQAANQALQIQWLQINMISTNTLPTDPTTAPIKEVDSLGDTTSSAGASSFLNLNVSQAQTVNNSNSTLFEPTGDVYPPNNSNDPSLDLIDWSIQVVGP